MSSIAEQPRRLKRRVDALSVVMETASKKKKWVTQCE